MEIPCFMETTVNGKNRNRTILWKRQLQSCIKKLRDYWVAQSVRWWPWGLEIGPCIRLHRGTPTVCFFFSYGHIQSQVQVDRDQMEWAVLLVGWFLLKPEGDSTFRLCALDGFVFICKLYGVPWATDCVINSSIPEQCPLDTLVIPLSLHPANESKHWTSSLKLFTRRICDLPGDIPWHSLMEMNISLVICCCCGAQ